jgi:hypothetical protein
MKPIPQFPYSPIADAFTDSTQFAVVKLSMRKTFVIVVATGATLASLGIALYTGWQSGGLLIERILRIVLVSVAILFVHWLPMGWSALPGSTRLAALTLWTVATTVILYGQVNFFMTSQQHAGDLRAATASAPFVLTSTNLPPGPPGVRIVVASPD